MNDDISTTFDPAPPPGFNRLPIRSGYGLSIGPLFERETADGGFIRAFRVGPHLTNTLNNCHGGMLMGFADVTFGHAISHRTGTNWITVRLLVDFIAGAPFGAWVEGTGRIVAANDSFRTVQGRIWSGETTIASGTGIFKVLTPR
ncbi:MAG: PaaI family thioesterase [Zavarzinia sp.]|nr:PaaI family thioesterase [Zavarzinia sp.]